MEKLTIKPWQVMQAHENGANVDSAPSDCSVSFQENCNPKFDWSCFIYRIANLTADGMRLDELVEKFQDELPVLCHSGNYITVDTAEFIKEMCETPSKIAKVKVKQEKKLRPWTMAEVEKHRDEWLCNKHVPGKFKILSIHENEVFIGRIGKASYEYLLNNYTQEDGSPCGVFE